MLATNHPGVGNYTQRVAHVGEGRVYHDDVPKVISRRARSGPRAGSDFRTW